MQIDVVIDVVCPWCYLGKAQLEAAIKQRPNMNIDLWWRPYQLGPDVPPEGIDRQAYYQEKFQPDQLIASRNQLYAEAEALGLKMDMEKPARIANTLDAHRLIRWSRQAGKQTEVANEVMRRYFEEGAFLGDHDLLVEIAASAGMDGGLVKELLKAGFDVEAVQTEVNHARNMGVQGVPVFIAAQKYAVTGAQGVDNFVAFLEKALAV